MAESFKKFPFELSAYYAILTAICYYLQVVSKAFYAFWNGIKAEGVKVGTAMRKKTKGQIEAQISEAITKFEREYMGRGPTETKAYILEDMVVVRLKGVFTPAEEQLAKTQEGAELIKKLRMQLLERAKTMLENTISGITGAQLVSMHTDISTKTAERIIIFVLNENLEKVFR